MLLAIFKRGVAAWYVPPCLPVSVKMMSTQRIMLRLSKHFMGFKRLKTTLTVWFILEFPINFCSTHESKQDSSFSVSCSVITGALLPVSIVMPIDIGIFPDLWLLYGSHLSNWHTIIYPNAWLPQQPIIHHCPQCFYPLWSSTSCIITTPWT